MVKQVIDITRPTPARRDAPLHDGRNERRSEAYSVRYVEGLSE
jgi:hypothetical protein